MSCLPERCYLRALENIPPFVYNVKKQVRSLLLDKDLDEHAAVSLSSFAHLLIQGYYFYYRLTAEPGFIKP